MLKRRVCVSLWVCVCVCLVVGVRTSGWLCTAGLQCDDSPSPTAPDITQRIASNTSPAQPSPDSLPAPCIAFLPLYSYILRPTGSGTREGMGSGPNPNPKQASCCNRKLSSFLTFFIFFCAFILLVPKIQKLRRWAKEHDKKRGKGGRQMLRMEWMNNKSEALDGVEFE